MTPSELAKLTDSDDPLVALPALGELLSWAETREAALVPLARAAGMSWAKVGELLGRSKQSTWETHTGSPFSDKQLRIGSKMYLINRPNGEPAAIESLAAALYLSRDDAESLIELARERGIL